MNLGPKSSSAIPVGGSNGLSAAEQLHQAGIPLVSPGSPLTRVLELYEQGLYIDSLAAGNSLGDIRQWAGPEGRVMAGRLANNLGAPRLGRALHWLAYRQWPQHPYCIYYGGLANWSRFGTLRGWQKLADVHMPTQAEPRARADWLAVKALMLATLRDFSRADQLMAEALNIDPHSPWLHVQHCELLDRQDAHQAALEAALQALRLQPWFRPAIQSAGHKLVQLNRDQEALELLSTATEHLQSGDVWCQLGALQQELQDYEAAWTSLVEAERLWPLAGDDSQHHKWLCGQRSDIAYYRGDYAQAIELATRVDRPFYDQLAERLEKAVEAPSSSGLAPRIQLPVPFIRQHHETCAPATLTALAQFWKMPVQHDEIVARICYEGTFASDERRWAEENGFLAREFRITLSAAEQLLRRGLPFTLNTVDPGSAHLQSIVGIDTYRGTFLIQDPSERHVGEAAYDKLLEHYASTGPRGMVMVPLEQAHLLEGIDLPDATQYDLHYAVERAVADHRRDVAESTLKQMQAVAAEHRLTLQAEMVLARYDTNTPEQLRIAEKLLLQYPGDANLTLVRLYCLSELGTRQQRLEILRGACEEKSHPIFWSRLASELLDDARDHAEAEQRLRKSLRYHQSDGRSMALLGNLLWGRSQRAEALELYRIAASVSEKDEGFARTYFSAARYLHETQTAKQWLQDRWTRFGSRSSLPGRTLAWALEQLDETQASLDLLQATAKQHPEDGEMLCHVALILGRYNQPEKAAEHLAAAQGKCADSVIMRTSALLALYQGKLALAREQFLAVYAREPLDTSALDHIVSLDMDLDGEDCAEQRLRDAVSQLPHSYSLRVQWVQWLRSNRLHVAKPEIEKFLEDYPQDAWGYREAAIVAAMTHDLQAANQYALTAIELDPTSDTAYFLLGRIALEHGNVDEARRHFRSTLEKNCDHESAIAALIDTCDRPADRSQQLDFVLQQLKTQTTFGDGVLAYRAAAAGRIPPDQVLAGVQEAIENRPDLWQCWSALIDQHMAMNDRDRAVEVAKQSTERFPLIPRMWVDLALVYRARGEFEAEMQALERARAINPNWTDVARELSESYMRDDRYDQAEDLLRQVLMADPRSPGAQAALADCLYRGGKQQAALEPMVKACLLAPAYQWAWQSLTEWSDELDAGETARAAARQLIQQRPHDARGPLRLAESLHEIDDLPLALEALEDALALDPRNIDAHVLKAFYLGRLHRWDDALQACSPAAFGSQIPVALQMRRAYVLQRKGALEPAIVQMRAALAEDPDHYQAWSQLADWAEEAGQMATYREAAEQLVRLDPHQPVPHGYLADAMLRPDAAHSNDPQAERSLAKEHLLTAIRLSPEYSYATIRLVDLCLEDNLPEEARQAVDLGGQHLAEGYRTSFEIRIAAALASRDDTGQYDAVRQLVKWCAQEEIPDLPLVQAVDSLDEQTVAQAAIAQLSENIRSAPDNALYGSALGRLLVRVQRDPQLMKTLRKLPDGSAWHACLCFVLRSLGGFERTLALLQKIKRKFGKRARSRTTTWAAMSNALMNFGKNADVVAWTADWKKRADITPPQMVSVAASNFELFRRRTAMEAAERGLAIADGESADGVDLLHIWLGLDRLISGDCAKALYHARHVNPHSLHGWYVLGYRLLVSAVESVQLADPTAGKLVARELLNRFSQAEFVRDPQFKEDRLTAWLLLKIQALLAKQLGRSTNYRIYALRAWIRQHHIV